MVRRPKILILACEQGFNRRKELIWPWSKTQISLWNLAKICKADISISRVQSFLRVKQNQNKTKKNLQYISLLIGHLYVYWLAPFSDWLKWQGGGTFSQIDPYRLWAHARACSHACVISHGVRRCASKETLAKHKAILAVRVKNPWAALVYLSPAGFAFKKRLCTYIPKAN